MASDQLCLSCFRAVLVFDEQPVPRIYEYEVGEAEGPGEALYKAVSHWKSAALVSPVSGPDCVVYTYRYLPGSGQPADVVSYVGLFAEVRPID